MPCFFDNIKNLNLIDYFPGEETIVICTDENYQRAS